MRKRTKKLSLHRETLRNLQARDLRRVAGGETNEILTTCACTETCASICFGCGTGSCGGSCGGGCGGSQEACGTGTTYEILSGCATNC